MEGLIVNKISKSYSNNPVVDNISFHARPGEILGLLGPNGAGKTTIIRMIMGITAPDQGDIIFDYQGEQSLGIPQNQVGYLPEERGLYKEAKVLQILKFLASLKNVNKRTATKVALEWLEKFNLQDYANAKVEELSKGMAQKVQFIASIIHQPQFIVLDEPFSGLDPVSQDVFKTEIRNLTAQGTIVLLSSHQMNIVEELCDRIFLIHKGKEIISGTLTEIKEHYGHYQVQIQTPSDKVIQALPYVIDSKQISRQKWSLTLAEQITPTQFLSEIQSGLAIEEISIHRPSLHDIFVNIATGGDAL